MAVNVLYLTKEDSTKNIDLEGKEYLEGEPVTLDENSVLTKVTGNQKIYGIMSVPANRYRNWVYGEYGAFGSGKARVIKEGIIQIAPEYYEEATGVIRTFTLWTEDVETAAPLTRLYVTVVDGIAKYTTDPTGRENTYVGLVVRNPRTNNGVLEIDLSV